MSIIIAAFLISAANPATATQTRSLTISQTNIWYGGVPMGQSAAHTLTLTNSGSGNVTITKLARTDSNFSTNLNLPLTIASGQKAQFVVTFTPTFVGHINAAFTLTSNATNQRQNFYVHGGGVQTGGTGKLVPNPSSLSFSGVQMGSSKMLTETLTNTGNANVTVSATTMQGGSQFSVSGPGLPLTLAAGHSMTLNVTFTPTSTNTATGNITVDSNLPNVVVALSGSSAAAGSLSVTPGSLAFGNVTVGSSASQTGAITASGSSVVVTAATVTSSEFKLSNISFPVTVAAGKSVSFTATFTPQSSGSASAKFTFTGNTSQATESLSGTGMAGASHSVGLSWQPSSSDVEGYNVYRGSGSSGPYSKITASLDGATTYTDTTVKSGTTYYYVTTAVGTDGMESSYSNQVKVTIPQ
jgi:hypothetical protein